jgi:hypothetical protein
VGMQWSGATLVGYPTGLAAVLLVGITLEFIVILVGGVFILGWIAAGRPRIRDVVLALAWGYIPMLAAVPLWIALAWTTRFAPGIRTVAWFAVYAIVAILACLALIVAVQAATEAIRLPRIPWARTVLFLGTDPLRPRAALFVLCQLIDCGYSFMNDHCDVA